MKTYTPEEKSAAKNSLPAPVSQFIDSPDLAETYADIEKKFRLNLRQTGALIEVIEVTLMGLEPQFNFPNNARGALQEVSNAELAEIIDHVNERVFSEAKRRLQESGTTRNA